MMALRVKGVVELGGLVLFVGGYFTGISQLTVVGGLVLVVNDIADVFMGILNPIFPVILAIALAIFLHPWYIGVFWASAVNNALNIPTNIIRIFNPRMIMDNVDYEDR